MPENPFDATPPGPAAAPTEPQVVPEPPAAATVAINLLPGAEPPRIGAKVFISGRLAPVTPDPELDQP